MTEPWLEGVEPGARPTKPRLDRLTWIGYVQLSLWAWFLYAFGATQSLLRDEQDTPRAIAALHGTAMALASLVGALLASAVIERWGRGVTMRVSALGAGAAILIYTLPGATFPVSVTGAALCGFFGTILLISINAFLLDYQGRAGPSALTQANALASFAGILGPVAVGVGAATVFGWRWGVWLVVILLAVVELWRGRRVAPFGTRAEAVHEAEAGRFGASVYWSLLALVLFVGAEFCLTLWGADLLRERCGFGPAAAAASLGSITSGMLIGRFYGARLAQHIPTERLLRGSVLFALCSFAIVWAFTLWPVVLLGLVLTGIGIGVLWPLGVARAVRASGGRTDRASAAASMAASVAIAVLPFTLAVLADGLGVHLAFLLVPLLLVLALVVLTTRPVPDDAPVLV
jgi:fucose permease